MAASSLSTLPCSALTVCQVHHQNQMDFLSSSSRFPCSLYSLPSSAELCSALLCPLLFMCPSSLHLLPQQHKCFSQNLPAYPGSSWEALAIYLPLQLSQGFPFCTFPNLSSCHLHHSQWLWQSQCWALQFCLQKPSTVRGCPCPRSLCPDCSLYKLDSTHGLRRTRIALDSD